MDNNDDIIDRLNAALGEEGPSLETLDAVQDAINEIAKLREALQNIDAVGVDHGYYERAARTMQETAREALFGPRHRRWRS